MSSDGVIAVPFPMSSREAERLINEYAQDPANVRFTDHAKEQMRDRDINDILVHHCLRKGCVHIRPKFNSEFQTFECKVEWFEAGEEIAIIAAIKLPALMSEAVIVITAYGGGEDGEF